MAPRLRAQTFRQMDRFKNYYRVLNIDSTADDPTIKAAFRRLARRYHPDLAKNARVARRFPDIREAYGVLSDPEKRRQYDRVYRVQTAVLPVAGHRESSSVRARPRSGSAGVGITLDLLGLRLGLAIDAGARRSPARNLPRRPQRKKR
jgi:curved DNA-binding protein CbpA